MGHTLKMSSPVYHLFPYFRLEMSANRGRCLPSERVVAGILRQLPRGYLRSASWVAQGAGELIARGKYGCLSIMIICDFRIRGLLIRVMGVRI
jgi:hypothetical protein